MDGSVTIGVGLDVSSFMTSLAGLETTMAQAAAACVSAFGGGSWSGAGNAAASGIASGIRGGMPSVSQAASDIAASVQAALAGGSWGSIGQNMMDGIASGVRSAGGEVVAAIRQVAAEAEAAVKDFYGIASPSKLMRDEVGAMISRGIAEGILDGAPLVNASLNAVMPARGGQQADAASPSGARLTQNIYLRDEDASPYRTARKIRRESEAMFR